MKFYPCSVPTIFTDSPENKPKISVRLSLFEVEIVSALVIVSQPKDHISDDTWLSASVDLVCFWPCFSTSRSPPWVTQGNPRLLSGLSYKIFGGTITHIHTRWLLQLIPLLDFLEHTTNPPFLCDNNKWDLFPLLCTLHSLEVIILHSKCATPFIVHTPIVEDFWKVYHSGIVNF